MITTEEKTKLHAALSVAFDAFIDAFSSFDDSVVNRVPFSGSWTPAQVVTHIILATDGVPDAQTTTSDRRFDSLLPAIRPWWEDHSQKFQAPEPLHPGNDPRPRTELLSELHRVREKDLAIIRNKDLTAVCLEFPLPTIGYLTRYEWLWFIEMHLRRHTFQLENMAGKVSVRPGSYLSPLS